jgi:hypothetical protein
MIQFCVELYLETGIGAERAMRGRRGGGGEIREKREEMKR